MAFPPGWPPRPASGRRSLRFYKTGTTTANWSDNAYLFIDTATANPYTPTPYVPPGGASVVVTVGNRSSPGAPMGTGANPNDVLPGDLLGQQKALIWAGSIRIFNDGANPIQISFTADNDLDNEVHAVIAATKSLLYRKRFEAGIALRFPGGGGASAFRIEAW